MKFLHKNWGKYDRETGEKLSLVDHCADVAAVVVALLESTPLGERLARIGGASSLSQTIIERLAFLAAIHDFGKLRIPFQRQILDGVNRRGGHTQPAVELLSPARGRLSATCRRILRVDEMYSWWGSPQTAIEMLLATICHHGRPLRAQARLDPRDWNDSHGYSPFGALAELTQAASSWFPMAFDSDAPVLPVSPDFQHAWNGILTLADWLGSNRDFFPFESEGDRLEFAKQKAQEALRHVGLDVSAGHQHLGEREPAFSAISEKGQPRAAQRDLSVLPISDRGSITVLEASTGAGKTEAAIWHFARLFQAEQVDGLYFALPTRTAATQIYSRLRVAIKRLFADKAPPVVLAVPGYLSVDGIRGERALTGFDVLWEDKSDEFKPRAWAGESSKRYLAGTVVVGTIDQILLSALQVKHAHLRASCLLRHLLVVDEVHASDAYMGLVLEKVLEHQRLAGGHALLMSATLGAASRERFLGKKQFSLEEAKKVPYPALHYLPFDGSEGMVAKIVLPEEEEKAASKTIQVDLKTLAEDPKAVASLALSAAEQGARVLVVRNTVTDCRLVQTAAVELAAGLGREDLLFGVHTDDGRFVPAPHHGRFAAEDRKRLDQAIETAFSPQRTGEKGHLAVATQTVEQSLDIDADLLITDLCPMDVLLQRLGRLHRHRQARPGGYEKARVVVLLPSERDLSNLLREDGTARGVHGLGGKVYPDLRVIEATWRQLEKRPELLLPDENRELVELSTHPQALAQLPGEEKFRQHMNKIKGQGIAERQHAELCAVDWQQGFGSFTFLSDEATIQTRLGDADIVVKLPSEPIGPFGDSIKQLSLRTYEVPDLALEPAAKRIESVEGGGFTFAIEGIGVRYASQGLLLDSATDFEK